MLTNRSNKKQQVKTKQKNKKEANFTIRENMFKICNIEEGKTQGSYINIVNRSSRGLYHIDTLSFKLCQHSVVSLLERFHSDARSFVKKYLLLESNPSKVWLLSTRDSLFITVGHFAPPHPPDLLKWPHKQVLLVAPIRRDWTIFVLQQPLKHIFILRKKRSLCIYID